MKRIRFTIASLLVVVLFLAVGFAALRESSDLWDSGLFSLTLGVPLISVLLAIHSTESRRAFWLGFAVFGWIYLGLTLVPHVESRLITTRALTQLDSKVPGRSLKIARVLHFGELDPRLGITGQSGSERCLHHRWKSACHRQKGRGETLGCDNWQTPRRLDRHNREFREDRTLAVRFVGGLVWRAPFLPSVPNFEIVRAVNGGPR